MRKIALLLAVVFTITVCLSGCGKRDNARENVHDDMIKKAIVELESRWSNFFEEWSDEEKVLEIKNTRVITLHDNDYLNGIEYVVEFALYTAESSESGTMRRDICEVTVDQDETMTVRRGDFILSKIAYLSYLEEDDDIVKHVDDYGDKYNCKKTLDPSKEEGWQTEKENSVALGNGDHEDMISDAVVVLQDYWVDAYDEFEENGNKERYFEIKNTRVFTLTKAGYEDLKDVEYVVDFLLYTDCYGIDEYYTDSWVAPAGKGGAVAVYRNGDMVVVSNNFIISACSDASGINHGEAVKSVDDYGDQYNCKTTLK